RRRVPHEELVQQRVLAEHFVAQRLPLLGSLVHHKAVATDPERAFERRQHALDRAAVRVLLGDRGFRKDILEVLQNDEAFLDHASFGGPQDRQRRRAAGPIQQPLWTGTRDVDDVKVDFATTALQLEEDLETL